MPTEPEDPRERPDCLEPLDHSDLPDLRVYLVLKESRERREPVEEQDPRDRRVYQELLDPLARPET